MEQKRRCRIICIFFYSGVHLEKVYESKKELSTGFSTVVNSNNIISQNAEKVNYVNTDNKGRQLIQEQQEICPWMACEISNKKDALFSI